MLIIARALAVLSVLLTLAAIKIIGCAIPADRLRSQGGIWRLFLFACVSNCRFGSRDWDRACALRKKSRIFPPLWRFPAFPCLAWSPSLLRVAIATPQWARTGDSSYGS